jgi:hypothetical protein
MDVTLGVSVSGTEARIALLDAGPPHAVIDQSTIDLNGQPAGTLASTLVSTDRMLSKSGHRLVGTRVCSPDPDHASTLVHELTDADLTNVTSVPQPDAITAVVRSLVVGETTAALVTAGGTAALSIVDADSETTSLIAVEPIGPAGRDHAYRTLLERFSEETGGATSVIVVGAPDDPDVTAELSRACPVPLRFPEAPAFALARGAAMAVVPLAAATAFVQKPNDAIDSAETMLGPQTPQLAYSEVIGPEGYGVAAAVPLQTPMQPLGGVDPEEYETADVGGAPPARPKGLVVGSTVAAAVVVGFAALAVSVAINIKPTVSQQTIRPPDEVVPGKYFPTSPGQSATPDGENWTVVENLPPAGEETDVRTFEAKPLSAVRAANVRPQVFEVYRDGTVGMQSAVAGPNPASGLPLPAGANPLDMASLVPRFIPDLSSINMCQVLGLLSNMQVLASQTMGGVATFADFVNPLNGMSLQDAGVVTAVSPAQGALFNTSSALSGIPGVGVIPPEIFRENATVQEASSVLPPGAEIITSLPQPVSSAGGSTGPVDFGAPIDNIDAMVPDPLAVLPGTVGPDVTSKLPEPGVDGPAVVPGGGSPDAPRGPAINATDDAPQAPSRDNSGGSQAEVPRQVGNSPVEAPKQSVGSPVAPPKQTGDAPVDGAKPEVLPPSKPDVALPPVPVVPPKVAPVPVEVEAPPVDVEPAPPVKVEAPPVAVEAPPQPAPPVSVPEPQVSIPEPVAPPPAPVAPAPAPAPVAPVIEMPSLPSLPSPSSGGSSDSSDSSGTAPELPILGSLFGG